MALLGIFGAVLILASPLMRGMFPKGSRSRRYATPFTLLGGMVVMSLFVILVMK